VETTDLPISIVKGIALHDDYHTWVAERDAWIEEHGTEALQTALNFSHSSLERDYIKERAAMELPGFIPDFVGLAEVRIGMYEPDHAILWEVERLSREGHHAYTQELRQPPYAAPASQPWQPCECVVIEGYLGCEYKLIKEFPVPF
jgi:hypothetical protein